MASLWIQCITVGLLALFCSGARVPSQSQRDKGVGVDPDALRNVTQLITSKGYPCEEHEVVTKDGYILGLQRIPRGRNPTPSNGTKPVVLVWHGLLACASCWVENLENQSLGFILADAGMDVWLANSRGTKYSRKHKTIDPKEVKFWDFSFDEMAEYDLPANIDYILNQTNQTQLYYVGHSQGTTIGFIGFEKAEIAKKVKTFFALAPVTTVTNMTSPLRYLSPLSKDWALINHLLGKGELLPNSIINKFLARNFCPQPELDLVCETVLFLLGGFDTKATNKSRIPVYVAENPCGTSIQTQNHFAQEVLDGNFQMYDYGAKENMKRYNQTTPPLYDVTKVEVPIATFTGGHDALADPADVKVLLPKIKNHIYHKNVDYWDHLDFIWGTDAGTVAYKPIIDLIHKTEMGEN